MALNLVCPLCRAEVILGDGMAGKNVICPKCAGQFTAPSVTSAPPSPTFGPAQESFPDSRDDALHDTGIPSSLPRYRPEDYAIAAMSSEGELRWKTTTTGLGLMFWSLAALPLLLVPMVIIFVIIASQQQGAGQPPPPEIAAQLAALGLGLICLAAIIFLLFVVYFVGMCMCCGVPKESGAKGRAIGSVLLMVLMLLGGFFFMLFAVVRVIQRGPQGQGQPPFEPEVMGIVVIVFAGLQSVFITLWMLFHRAVALYFHNRQLARSSLTYLVVSLILMAIGILLQLSLMEAQGNPPNPATGLGFLISLIGNLVLFVWFLSIIRRTRTTILDGVAYKEQREDDEY